MEVRAASLAEVPTGRGRLTEVNGTRVVLARVGDRVYACADTCSHRGGPLSEGKLAGASQSRPGPLAFAEGAAAMRARVGSGIYPVPDAGQHHARPVDLGQPAAARGDLREGGRADLHALSARLRLRPRPSPHMSSFKT